MSTAEIFERLAIIYRNGGSSPFLEQALAKLLAHERDDTRRQAEELRAGLAEFERTHGVESQVFFDRYERGEMGDSAEYFEWASLYKMYLRVAERLSLLESSCDE